MSDLVKPTIGQANWGGVLNDALDELDGDKFDLDGANDVTLPDSLTYLLHVDVPNDGSATSGWPDRLAFYYVGQRTGYHNEYGELRARPAKQNTTALRVMAFPGGSTGNIFEVASSSSTGTPYLRVSEADQVVEATFPVVAPNIGAMVLVLGAADPVPAGTPAGSVIVRTP